MTAAQAAAIRRHGEQLLAIWPHATERDPIKLCKRLRWLELRAHGLALRLCNGPEYSLVEADREEERILHSVSHLLGDGPAVRLNRDPRGYALKLADDYPDLVIHRDWGGCGILCPTIDAKGTL